MKLIFPKRRVLSAALNCINLVPVTYRFGLVKRSAKILTPLARAASIVVPPPFALDNFDDYLLSVMFTSLTHHGIEYQPKIVVRAEKIDLSKGAIVVSGHFFLNYFVFRWLYDQGARQSAVIRDIYDQHKVLGTKATIDVIKPDLESFREIKKRLTAGEIVSICIDHHEKFDGWVKLDVPKREIYITEKVFQFAERLGAPVIFVGTKVNKDNEIEIYATQPAAKNSAAVTVEFADFLKSVLSENKK